MKILKFIYFAAFLITCCSNGIFAQITPSYTNTEVITVDRYIRYQGDPYLFEQWMPGNVYGPDNEVIPQLKINYNAQNNQFEVRNADGASSSPMRFFTISSRSFRGRTP